MNQPTTQSVTLVVESQLENTVLIAMAVRGLCALTPLPETEVNRIELCVVEIVNNAIEHAYGHEQGHKVEVDVFVVPDQSITINVVDYGKKIPVSLNELLEPREVMDLDNPDTWKLSGRGLSIVQRVMDELRYDSEDGRNCFSMSRSFV